MSWSTEEKIALWSEFLHGASVQRCGEMFGGTPDEVKQWISDVCSGREICQWQGDTHTKKWTDRKLRLLRRMRNERLHYLTACRLLGHSPEQVKKTLQTIVI